MAQREWPDLALALHDGRIAEQGAEARTVERCRHGDEAEVVAQSLLRVDRQCQCEIAVEAALVNLVEQHRRHALKFRIGEDAVAEKAWRHHERSEEHTSELQSLMRISYAVFCLKKKKHKSAKISKQTN